MSYKFELQNFGPSIISNFYFQLQIPSNYSKTLNFMNITQMIINAKYDNRNLEPMWNSFRDDAEGDDIDIIDINMLNGNSKRRKREISNNLIKPEDNILSTIPANRTIYLNCSNSIQCENIGFHIEDFEAGNKIATIELELFINHVKLCRLSTFLSNILILIGNFKSVFFQYNSQLIFSIIHEKLQSMRYHQ